MNNLSFEFGELLNLYENKNELNEVYDTLTETSSIEDNVEDNIEDNVEDNVEIDNIKDGIYNIESNIEIKNNEIINIVLNPRYELKKEIEKCNKELKLFYELKNDMSDNLQNINNKKYEYIKNKKEKEKEYLIKRIKAENEDEMINIKRTYENKYKYLELDIENKYKNKIDMIEDKYKNILEIMNEKIKNIKEQTENEYKLRIEYITKQNEELEKMKTKIENEKDQILFLTTKNIQTKGKEGELEVEEYIRKKIEIINNKSKIENVSKDKKESSDLYLEHNKLKCVIEVKNHKSTISKNDLKKFEEVYIKNIKYNCGIYISLESEYSISSNKNDFKIEIINEKPVIYLSNVILEKDKIILAIKILEFLLENKEEYNFNQVVRILEIHANHYTRLLKNSVDIQHSLNNLSQDIKKCREEIYEVINIKNENIKPENKKTEHYTKLENNLIQCNYCCQKPYDISKTSKYIIKHLFEKHGIEIEYIEC